MVICGKGGCGKSTILALLARQYAAEGKKILVIDTDESNTGLHRLLGMDAPDDLIDFLGGKKPVTEKIMNSLPDLSSLHFFSHPICVNKLPAGYVTKKGSIKLVSIGKIHSFGEGCACPMGIVAKQFLSGLTDQDDEIVLVDTEAGIEHFGRGIEEGTDLILMIVDPSYESVLLTRKISEMSGIRPDMYYMLNKIDSDTGSRLRCHLLHPEKIIGEMGFLPVITRSGLDGEVLDDYPPEIFQVSRRLSAMDITS
ncbi:MAG: P-loop NTPase [Methanospirillum sp.]|nr:P-loop NTPase [Methanospirillum sp.]